MDILIEGVSLYPLKHIVVPKGDLFHVLKSTDDGYAGFGEVYLTQINSHQVKGWKRHNRYVLNLIVISGSVKFVIYDDRVTSATKGFFFEITLSPKENYQRLNIYPGLWMAFAGVDADNSSLLDIIPEPHDPMEADKKELSEIPYNFDF